MRLGFGTWAYRPGVDVSLPPGPTERCSSSVAERAQEEGLHRKKYFLTFKGELVDGIGDD